MKQHSNVMYSGAYSARMDDMDENIKRESVPSPRFNVNMSGIEPTQERRENEKMPKKSKSTISHKITKYEQLILELPLGTKLRMVLGNNVFGFLLAAITVLFHVCTAIQFWATNYFIEVIGVTREQAFMYFSIMALTGPVLGAIIGGAVIGWIGGYNNPRAYFICLFVVTFSLCFSVMIPFTSNFYAVISFLWL